MKYENIVLASASPRRQELLGLICEDFDVCVSDVEESVPEGIELYSQPEYLARLKALEVAKKYPQSIVIGADTSVFADNMVLGKPKNEEDAFKMLSALSGKKHLVITGCAIVKESIVHSFSVTTEVEFYELNDKQILDYIATKDCMDKAGSYGIQTGGVFFVKGINGDYNNVVGLPVAELKRQLDLILE